MKNNKKIIIAACVLVAVLAILLGFYFANKPKSSDSSAKEETKTEQSSEAVVESKEESVVSEESTEEVIAEAPETEEVAGEDAEDLKQITIKVENKEGEVVEYSLKTDAEFLVDAMNEAEGLTYNAVNGFVDTINDQTADWNTDQSYWAIYVNGEYGMYGIESQPVEDGFEFLFQYTIG